jgi:hypothetical protein
VFGCILGLTPGDVSIGAGLRDDGCCARVTDLHSMARDERWGLIVDAVGVVQGVRRSWLYPLADARGCIDWGRARDDAGVRDGRENAVLRSFFV